MPPLLINSLLPSPPQDVRGYMTSHGMPDCPRSARYILKDYVKVRVGCVGDVVCCVKVRVGCGGCDVCVKVRVECVGDVCAV